MEFLPPFRLTMPARPESCAVFSSPHSGAAYPAELLSRSCLNALELRASEDAFVDRLFEAVGDLGAPLLAATYPRAWVDLNRGPNELDPALIRDVRTAGLNQRIAAGLGVIPRIVAEGTAIYDGKISLQDAEHRIEHCHRPYHAMLYFLAP